MSHIAPVCFSFWMCFRSNVIVFCTLQFLQGAAHTLSSDYSDERVLQDDALLGVIVLVLLVLNPVNTLRLNT